MMDIFDETHTTNHRTNRLCFQRKNGFSIREKYAYRTILFSSKRKFLVFLDTS